jgi:predicted secreted hydrolase
MKNPKLKPNTEIITRERLTDKVSEWEDGLRTDVASDSFEWWYFDANFDDGSTAVIVFFTTPMLDFKGPVIPQVSLSITRPNGDKIEKLLNSSADQFSASKDTCDVRIGENWVKGDLKQYDLQVEIEGVVADLTFIGIVPAWHPNQDKAYYGNDDHYFAWLPAIPYGVVEGSLSYDGEDHKVNGNGYHDHNWGTIGLYDITDYWYWGRARIGDYSLIFAEKIAAKKYGFKPMSVFMLAKGREIIAANGPPLSLEARDFIKPAGGQRKHPNEVDIKWQKGEETVRMAIRNLVTLDDIDFLLDLPIWKRSLLRLRSNPHYFRFNADIELKIDMNNEKITENGKVLFEIMVLQGKKFP